MGPLVRWAAIGAIAWGAGCAKERDPAPDDLDGLAHYVFRNWEDDELVTEGITNLIPWLEGEGSTETAFEGYLLSDIAEPDLASVDYPPGVLLSDATGVGQTGLSAFDPLDHAALIVRADQTWNEPSTYEQFNRTIAEGDADAFAAGEGMVRTDNDIIKSGAFGVTIPFEQNKDYKWVHTEDGADVIVGRSWVAASSCSENGKNCVIQSYSIDVFHGPPGGGVVRLIAGWNQLKTEVDALVTQDFLVSEMVKGNQDIMDATEELLLSGG